VYVLIGKCEGIVIRNVDYGETSKIVTIYTKELGKISLMARGAKKPVSKLSGITQLLQQGYFLFHAGNGMGTLQQGESIRGFRNILEDIYLTSYATFMSELLDRTTEEKQKNTFLFELFERLLEYLNDGYDPEIILNIFELKILSLLGIAPELSRCVNCGHIDGNFMFSTKEGGIICHRCIDQDRYALPISVGAAKIMRMLYLIDVNRLGNISISEQTKHEIRELIDQYYEKNSGLYLKSKKFLKQMESMKLVLPMKKD
jgi:DNA repair protein RecO (recombination protein O)